MALGLLRIDPMLECGHIVEARIAPSMRELSLPRVYKYLLRFVADLFAAPPPFRHRRPLQQITEF
jgi:hypothetical protein